MDPMTLMMIGSAGAGLLGPLMGGKQTGAPAPAYSPGGAQTLQPLSAQPMSAQQQPQQEGLGGLLDLDIASLLESVNGGDDIGGAGSVLSSLGGATDAFKEGSTPESPTSGLDKLLGGVDGFLGGLDEGLQSPAQLLGLGLLGQLGDRRLPLAGLLAMGLFNQRKP